MKAKLTRTDGSVLELDGTVEEIQAVLAAPAPFTITPLQPTTLPFIPYPQQPFYSPSVSPFTMPTTITCLADLPRCATNATLHT